MSDASDENYKKDKTGQYVKKSTKVANPKDGGIRPTRPKFEFTNPTGDFTSYVIPAPEPCLIGDPCWAGEPFVPYVIFESSVGKGLVDPNPNFSSHNPSYIYDLKIAKGDDSTPLVLDGYTKIPLDLNKGAGGTYIYLTFTRDPGQEKGPISSYAQSSSRYQPLRFMEARAHDYWIVVHAQDGPMPPVYHYFGSPFYDLMWNVPDLNDGAGGRYIYPYQSKFSSYGGIIKEVGVIASNTKLPAPPAGWDICPVDLNWGAGGDYIYFCYKR